MPDCASGALRDHRVHAAEEFLHAYAVERDEDNVVAVVGSLRGQRGQGEGDGQAGEDADAHMFQLMPLRSRT